MCDTFCETPDPDCGVQCEGIPVCDPGHDQVDICYSSSCVDVTMCGTTIYCEPMDYCLSALSPIILECPEHYEPVEGCDPGADCQVFEGYCGEQVLYCQASEECNEPMVCPDPAIITTACGDNDSTCFEYEVCNQTIYCVDVDVDCEMSCPDFTQQVPECDLSDQDCTEISVCGTTLMCLGGI